jgi:hypothetical protein
MMAQFEYGAYPLIFDVLMVRIFGPQPLRMLWEKVIDALEIYIVNDVTDSHSA